jgi:hypothetical protein
MIQVAAQLPQKKKEKENLAAHLSNDIVFRGSETLYLQLLSVLGKKESQPWVLFFFLASSPSQQVFTHKKKPSKTRNSFRANPNKSVRNESWKRRWLRPSHHDFLSRRPSLPSGYVLCGDVSFFLPL